MLNNKMYKLETITKYCTDFCIIVSVNNIDEILEFCTKSKNINTVKEMDYVRCACTIPYDEMLKYIDYYHKHVTDENSYVDFIDKIATKYDVPFRVANKRFNDVKKLSDSLIYKEKMAKIYNIDTKKTKIKK